MRKYFGTDGIRGEANRELTAMLAMKLGYALGYYLKQQNPDKKKLKVIMGSAYSKISKMSKSLVPTLLQGLAIHVF